MNPTLDKKNPLPSGVEETPQETLNRAKALTGSISASELTNAPEAPPLTPPVEAPEFTPSQTVDNVTRNAQGLITAQTEEAARLKELREQYANIAGEGTLADMFKAEQERYGIPQNLKELQDIELQLAANTEGALGKAVQGASAPGQTLAGAQRAITREQIDNNVRSYGLAARAAVLTGNIETASALVKDAVNLAYQDRQLKNQNLINQINDLRGVVDDQTQQLLDQEERKYQEDQRQIMRAENAVDSAVASGYASVDEIQRLVDLSGDPEMQRDYAYGIVARGAVQDRILQQQAQRASIAASATARRKNLVELGMTGDPTAIEELGFDPREELQKEVEALEAEEKAQMELAAGKENERLQRTLDDLTYLMGNETGLQTSTGQFRNATISGLVPFAGDSMAEISGGIPGAVKARTEKDDWLATIGRIVTEDGFESLIEVNERVRLTPITNAEIALAFQAAGELQNAAIKKGSAEEGTQRIVGFRMSEERVRENLAQMYLATQKAQEEAAYINEYGYEGLLELQQLQEEANSGQ